jgi:putative flippase GtrA
LAQTIERAVSSESSHGEPPLKELITTIPTQPLKTHKKAWRSLFWQIFRFGLVGGLNTIIDLLIFNGLLWLWPTQSTTSLLAYNSFAYAFGAINSFILNKYWTFQNTRQTTYGEVLRFALTTLGGVLCNDGFLWAASHFLHPVMINATLWANTSKVLAISGTFMISYMGMRLWVFAHQPGRKQ